MDGVAAFDLSLFLLATFAAALVAGLAGFAFGIVAAAAWLHVLSPGDSAALIVGFGLIVQGVAVWKLRRALDWRRFRPFLAGGALGVPFGVAALAWAQPGQLRAAVGLLLVAYSLHALARPALKLFTDAPVLADAGVGFLSGVLGGSTGLGGILPTAWCGLRGWTSDEQRAVYQPVAVAIFVMTALWLGAQGSISRLTIALFLLGLPVLLAGTWLGLRLYGKLDPARFRKVVLLLLLVSGLALVVEKLAGIWSQCT
jgi:uncharacterized membrane protein YfcA